MNVTCSSILQGFSIDFPQREDSLLVGISDKNLIYCNNDGYEKIPLVHSENVKNFISDVISGKLDVGNLSIQYFHPVEDYGFLIYDSNGITIDLLDCSPVYTICGTKGDDEDLVEILYRVPIKSQFTYDDFAANRKSYIALMNKIMDYEYRTIAKDFPAMEDILNELFSQD